MNSLFSMLIKLCTNDAPVDNKKNRTQRKWMCLYLEIEMAQCGELRVGVGVEEIVLSRVPDILEFIHSFTGQLSKKSSVTLLMWPLFANDGQNLTIFLKGKKVDLFLERALHHVLFRRFRKPLAFLHMISKLSMKFSLLRRKKLEQSNKE